MRHKPIGIHFDETSFNKEYICVKSNHHGYIVGRKYKVVRTFNRGCVLRDLETGREDYTGYDGEFVCLSFYENQLEFDF